MKKLFTLCIVVIAFACKSSAQIVKGEKMLGGNLGIGTQKSVQDNSIYGEQNSKAFSVGLYPELGFGIGEGWVLGISAEIAAGNQKNQSGFSKAKYNYTSFGGGVFARKFHGFNEHFGIFGQAQANYSGGKVTSQQDALPESKGTVTSVSAAIVPGGYFRINKRFIIETRIGGLSYTHLTSKTDDSPQKSKSSALSFSLTNSLTFGFKVVL